MNWYRPILSDKNDQTKSVVAQNENGSGDLRSNYMDIGHNTGDNVIIWWHDGRSLSSKEIAVEADQWGTHQTGHASDIEPDEYDNMVAMGRVDPKTNKGSFAALWQDPRFKRNATKIISDLLMGFPGITFIDSTSKNVITPSFLQQYANNKKNIKTAGNNQFGYAQEMEHEDGLQRRWMVTYGDPQRNKNDAYQIQITKTKTKYKISICVDVWNGHQSQMIWQDFWKFALKENKKADQIFDKFKKRSSEIIDKFMFEELPTSMLHAYVRTELRSIYGSVAATNIPSINYSYQYSSQLEPDWRSLIYGTRYPSPADIGTDTSGF